MTNQNKIILTNFLKYLEKTQDSEWLVDKCADTQNLNKCCVFAHLFKFAGGSPDSKNDAKANKVIDYFENNIANTFMLFPVNDGKDEAYQQDTPKQRCIHYLKDLGSGKAKTIIDLMNEDIEKQEAGQLIKAIFAYNEGEKTSLPVKLEGYFDIINDDIKKMISDVAFNQNCPICNRAYQYITSFDKDKLGFSLKAVCVYSDCKEAKDV